MENGNQDEVRQWVLQQTTYLDPPRGWRPDPAAALMRFHTRVEQADRPRAAWGHWPAWAAAAALLIAIILVRCFYWAR